MEEGQNLGEFLRKKTAENKRDFYFKIINDVCDDIEKSLIELVVDISYFQSRVNVAVYKYESICNIYVNDMQLSISNMEQLKNLATSLSFSMVLTYLDDLKTIWMERHPNITLNTQSPGTEWNLSWESD